MSETTQKWSKGPWKAHPASSVVGAMVSYGDISKGETVCAVLPQWDKAVTEANALLISKTPEMAELLREACVGAVHPDKFDMPTWLGKVTALLSSLGGK